MFALRQPRTVCPLFRHQEQEKRWERETERKNWPARRQLCTKCDIGLWTESDLYSFHSASARRPLHMRARKGGRTSSRFTSVSDMSFGRTLTALRDAPSVLPFPFKIFEEGLSLLLQLKAKVHTCMATESKQIPGFGMAKLCLPASYCELLLPSFVWRASMHMASRKQRSLFLWTAAESKPITSIVSSRSLQTMKHATVNYHNKWSPPEVRLAICPDRPGGEKNFHTHALTARSPNHHLARRARSVVIWQPPLRAGAWNFNPSSPLENKNLSMVLSDWDQFVGRHRLFNTFRVFFLSNVLLLRTSFDLHFD